jgi:hypothetical protein
MPIRFTSLMTVAVATSLLTAGAASAQDHKHRKGARSVTVAEISARPLTVQKRSFLDPGNVVAPGSDTPEYLAATTTENVPVYANFAPARFGESTLAGRFDLPNNPRFDPERDLDFSPF